MQASITLGGQTFRYSWKARKISDHQREVEVSFGSEVLKGVAYEHLFGRWRHQLLQGAETFRLPGSACANLAAALAEAYFSRESNRRSELALT